MGWFTNKFNSIYDDGSYELYNKLERYYKNNKLYDTLEAELTRTVKTDIDNHIKPCLTGVHRSVEFFAGQVMSGDSSKIKITTPSPEVEKAIRQIWKWSNFSNQKQVYIRQLSLYGDLFIRVSNNNTDKVYLENINPKFVTDFKCDNRGFVQEIRIDYQFDRGEEFNEQIYWHTEYISKENDMWAIWEHNQGRLAPIENLGDPIFYNSLSAYGLDFVPVVHCKFSDFGYKRGASCVFHALEKIDELNQQYQGLLEAAIKFKEPLFTATSDQIKNGQYIPPPAINGKNSSSIQKDLAKYRILYIPGGINLGQLTPNLQYADLLSIIKYLDESIEKDLPELRYSSLQSSELSGKAIRLLLSSAISRADECRGNFTAALKRINEMALTIGTVQGIFPQLAGMNFQNGDFDHEILSPNLFPMTVDEISENIHNLYPNGLPLRTTLEVMGYDQVFIDGAMQAQMDESNSVLTNTQTLMNNKSFGV
jgi:hypothetical protein